MPDPSEASELRVLQGVRLAGVADRDAVLDRSFVADEEVDRVLRSAKAENLLEWFTFGETGWILTEAGGTRLATLLRNEVAGQAAASVLEATVTAFEVVNEEFVGMVSRWQLESTSPTGAGAGTADQPAFDELLRSLASLGARLRATLAELVGVLPRFGRYPAQYAAALERAGTEGLRWVTGVGLLSCHVVWAELHQDLLARLGRERLGNRQNG